MKTHRPLGRPSRPETIIHRERIKGTFWNNITGNFHQTLRVKITRADGTRDNGKYVSTLDRVGSLSEGGTIPNHPTTGKPLENTPDNRGLQINPKPMGTLTGGVVVVRIDGVLRNASHLAWKEQTGEQLPKGTRIKHKDGNPWNNHISNLERVGAGTGGSYQAATRVAGVRVALGSYKTREAATEAVRAFRESVGAGPVRAYKRKTVTGADHPATL